MKVIIKTSPIIEPITLSQLCEHLRIDPDTLAENLTPFTCTGSGSHAVTTGYTLYGTAVEVLGKKALVFLRPVNNGTGATVDCKIQDSDDNTTWTDVASGAFIQVTEVNDTVIQEKEYTGIKRYIRTASKTLVQACEFGTDVIVKEATTVESNLLNDIIIAAREHVEDICRRVLITQTWNYYLDRFPCGGHINIPFGNLQSAGLVITYKDCDGVTTTMTLTDDYLIEQNGEGIGRIILPYGMTWPSATLHPSNPVVVEFVAGWTTAALVPYRIKTAIKLLCADFYEMRGEPVVGQTVVENKAVERLLSSMRLWGEF